MLLKYIKFVNFRQYKDEQIISFSTDPNKNVTVVLGENTCGKTTLVQAMNWVLYNDILFDDDILVNRELLEEVAIWEEVVAEVEIRIKHNELDYVINRKQSYQKDDMGRIKKVKSNVSMVEVRDSNTKIVAPTEISEKINSIIPFDLSNYFFFTGEKIKNVTKKRDLSGAVKRLMGLDALVNAEKHLNIESSQGVYKVFARDLENDNQEEIDSLDEKINKADRENVELEEQLVSLNGELDKYTSRRDELRSKMQEYDKMNSLQNDIDSKKSMLNYFKEDIVRNEKDMVTAFSDKIYFVYAKVLASKSLDTLNSLSDKGESEALPSVNAKTIDEILKRKKCICGNEFCDGDDTYKTLINAKDYYPPKSLGTCISDFKHDLKKYSDNLNGYYSNFDSKYKNKIEINSRINKTERELEILSSQMGDLTDLKDIKEKFDNADEKINDLNKRIGNIEGKIESNKELIEDCEKKKAKYVVSTDKNASINLRMEYAKRLYEYFNNAFKKKESEIHDKLSVTVNSYFQKMYHEKKSLTLTDDYRIILTSVIGDTSIETENSNGEEAVKNFAFVCGLAKVAKSKMLEKVSEELIMEEPYPLLMDAPFSDLDETHVHNISCILPEAAEQVIMVVMNKDWKFARDVLADKIGKAYSLRKKSSTLTQVEEVENV